MKKIAIFIEKKSDKLASVGLELLSETRRKVGYSAFLIAIVLGAQIGEEEINQLKVVGPDEIIIAEHGLLKVYDTHYYTTVLSDIVAKHTFDVLLLGSTILGRDLAPRLSARLHTGLTADATILDFDVSDDRISLLATRPALGGNLFATIICPKTLPQMASIRPGVFAIESFDIENIKVSHYPVTLVADSKVKIISRKKVEKDAIELSSARLIIAGGRGVANQFHDVKTIANLVGGEAAASRAVIDANIEAKDRLVGQTGANVKPAIYLALGISGAVQHVSGMEKSELIIAVNNDPDALIFKVADVSLVCDAKEVMPYLIKDLQALKGMI